MNQDEDSDLGNTMEMQQIMARLVSITKRPGIESVWDDWDFTNKLLKRTWLIHRYFDALERNEVTRQYARMTGLENVEIALCLQQLAVQHQWKLEWMWDVFAEKVISEAEDWHLSPTLTMEERLIRKDYVNRMYQQHYIQYNEFGTASFFLDK